jgi:cytochrome P450 family 4
LLKFQNKILEKQREIFDNVQDQDVTFASLQKMKYLDNVIKEGLGLYSPVPIFARESDQEIQYSMLCNCHKVFSLYKIFADGMTILKAVRLIVFAHGLHMNPKFFPDPEKFDPSRFENLEKRPFAFIPFGAGLRNCIGKNYLKQEREIVLLCFALGQKFAMLLIKSVVSKIVRNFELSPAFPSHHMELVLETVLKSASGVKIGLKLRQNI